MIEFKKWLWHKLFEKDFEKQCRNESIAYSQWINSLAKTGFPRNENGSWMNVWELHTYYIEKSGKRKIFVDHAKKYDK